MIDNTTVKSTYYSFVAARGAVLLVARWMEDHQTGATCWTELAREEHIPGDDASAAWERLIARYPHLVPVKNPATGEAAP